MAKSIFAKIIYLIKPESLRLSIANRFRNYYAFDIKHHE